MKVWARAAACICALASSAFAWGDHGHQAVNSAAVRLLEGRHRALARLLAPNAALLRRLAITPDADWKAVSEQELPLHFFEVDAFIAAEKDPAAVMFLPSGEYLDVYPQYRGLLAANLDFVERLAPYKPRDPAAHGTAPWRVLQLYDAAVAALRRRDRAGALLALGVLGHYAADLAQPLHTTVDFDGAHHGEPAAGIHAAFESRMLEREALRGGLDKPVESAAALGRKGLEPLPRDKVLRELFSLVRRGYPMVKPLTEAFARQCRAARDSVPGPGAAAYCSSPEDVPDMVVAAFAGSALSVRDGRAAQETTVLKAAQKRLGAAAVLLARLWASAYEAAGSPHFGPGVVRFEDLRVLDRYPVPDYLPAPGQPEVRRLSGGVETITPVAALLADKKGHDQKFLCAKGRASVLFRKTSRKGNAYFTFWLNEGGARVKVHSYGAPDFGEGAEVEACGRFTIEKHVSGRVFYDELSAQVILQGQAMQAGYVELTPAGVLPVKH